MIHWLLRFILLGLLAAAAQAQPTERVYLSGRGQDDAVLWKFMCTKGALAGCWTNLPVPSNWDVLGFGHLTYKKDYDNALTERGHYEKNFPAPNQWKDKRVFLVFEGAMTDTSAKLNGQSVGPTHQGGFYRFNYEVTDKLKLGAQNQLEVTVAKHSANESVNKAERLADYWVFGGIYRPVYLEVVPKQFIERVAIDARADGTFAVEVFLNGVKDADSVEAQIATLAGKLVGQTFLSAGMDDFPVARSGNTGLESPVSRQAGKPVLQLKTRINSPKLWTAETPNLYRVEVRLKRGAEVLHTFTERFGFRTFEVRDGDGLYLNGQKIILKGVNRHSFWPDSGRCLSEAVHRLDIETIKEMNGNAVRMSHYPPDKEFLELCDELGLYVLNELAGWHNQYDTDIGTKLVEAMVTRDVNHPSIIFWNNGNEGGSNPELDEVFYQFDPQQRRVLHPWGQHNGINTAHYLMFTNAELAARGAPMHWHMKENAEFVNTNLAPSGWIYLPTEFMHGLYDGGAGAGLEDYWNMMMSYSNCAGGFIWAFADEGIKNPHTGKLDTAGNQAPDGIVGPYREREGSFYAIKQLWSPIQVTPFCSGTYLVQNRSDFTDANGFRFTWQWRRFRGPEEVGGGHEVLAEEVVLLPPIPPRGSGQLLVPTRDVAGADSTALIVSDRAGREVLAWSRLLKPVAIFPDGVAMAGRVEALRGSNSGVVDLKAGDLEVRVDPATGYVTQVQRNRTKFSLAKGPRLVALNGQLTSLSWQLRADGWLQCQYTYTAAGTNDAIGVGFDYPEQFVKRKRWLGNGSFRVWKNRLGGGIPGVWENDYNNTITGHSGWVYPEFKGCFANVRWLQLETTEGLITVVPENIPYVQVLTPEQPPDNLIGKTKVNLPQCGLGFLHAIPPIGSKFKDAASSGPQGQPNVGQGEYSGQVSFFFGALPGEK